MWIEGVQTPTNNAICKGRDLAVTVPDIDAMIWCKRALKTLNVVIPTKVDEGFQLADDAFETMSKYWVHEL